MSTAWQQAHITSYFTTTYPISQIKETTTKQAIHKRKSENKTNEVSTPKIQKLSINKHYSHQTILPIKIPTDDETKLLPPPSSYNPYVDSKRLSIRCYYKAKRQFECDDCGCREFKISKHHRRGTSAWNCADCDQAHIDSSRYPPCITCGNHKFYLSYSNQNIVCHFCKRIAARPFSNT